MAENKIQKVETEFGDTEKVGGFLAAMMIFAFLFGVYGLVMFFVGLAQLVGGVSNGNQAVFASSIMIGGLICSAGFILTGLFINFRKKLAKLFAWITLGVYFLATTVAMIAIMTITYTSYDYGSSYYGDSTPTTTGLPAGVIVMLIGVIFVAALESGLAALYFIISKRAKATLVK
jgi:hypothetical protein